MTIFPLLEIDTSAKLTTESFEHLLRRIGWKYSCDPRQVQRPFEDTFDLLGIRLTAKVADGVVTLPNKASRLYKMKDAFIRFGLRGQWNLREVQSLQGQVNFALGFASGRALKMLQRALGSFIREPEVRTADDLRALCEFWHQASRGLQAASLRMSRARATCLDLHRCCVREGSRFLRCGSCRSLYFEPTGGRRHDSSFSGGFLETGQS